MSKTSPFIDIPVVFISALTKQRIFDAIKIAMEVNERRNYKISTKKLNDLLLPIITFDIIFHEKCEYSSA